VAPVVFFAGLVVVVGRVPAGAELGEVVALGRSSPLRVTIVAAEQVEMLESALLTASASEQREPIC